ncbi:MAG: nucleotidyltransferase domain-containing protein [Clostridia bacterium]|nr:MAG: nucleotidyltransferase domain-containing protein [Clostridia bacterium]
MARGARVNMSLDERPQKLSRREKGRIRRVVRETLAERREVRFAFLHGSFLDNIPCQDVDVAVYYEPDLDSEAQMDLSLSLAAQLSVRARIEVDVHGLNQARLPFRYAATRGEVMVMRDEQELGEFLERTWRDYLDFEPLYRATIEDILAP